MVVICFFESQQVWFLALHSMILIRCVGFFRLVFPSAGGQYLLKIEAAVALIHTTPPACAYRSGEFSIIRTAVLYEEKTK